MKSQIYFLHTIAFLDLFAVSVIVPLISNHVREMGGSHIIIGMMGSIYAGTQLVSSPLIGSLSDIKGRKTVLAVTLLISGVTYLIIGLTSSIIALLLLRILLGAVKQTQTLTKALVPDLERDKTQQSDTFGKQAAISGVGFILGPIVGGHLMEYSHSHGFMLAAGLTTFCFLLNTAIVQYCLKSNDVSIKKRTDIDSSILTKTVQSLKQSVDEILSVDWKNYWEPFLYKVLVGFCMGVYFSSYSMLLKTKYGLSPKYIGYTISLQGTVVTAVSFLISYINVFYKNDKDYSLRTTHTFIAMSISLIGFLSTSSIYMFLFWLIPFSICNAVMRLITLEIVLMKCDDKHRGTLIGASSSMRSLSGVVAPMVAGFVGHYLGTGYILYASLFTALLGTIISAFRKMRRKEVEDEKLKKN